jgi:heme exporter protein C
LKHWYKILASVLILYSLVAGMVLPAPALHILNESIRNVYFHVPIWFAMLFMMMMSSVYSIGYLSSGTAQKDNEARNAAFVGFFFAIPGIATGSLWAKYTWGTWWTFQDPKLNGVAIGMLIYLAYFILRSSVDDEVKRARLAAVYNIFAFVMLFVLIMILPRLTDSLHPGNGGNPAFAKYDLDNRMRLIFYPAVIGWILFSCWLLNIKNRMSYVERRSEE